MRMLDLIAIAALGAAAWNIVRISRMRRDRGARREALQTWESEGGAVPVSPSTIAAQVSPAPDAVQS
jgi:hypothetical protein